MKRVGQDIIRSIFPVLLGTAVVAAKPDQFRYQESLNTAGTPANGNYDLEFVLFDALNGG